MVEKFVLALVIDGITKRKKTFTRAEIKLLMEGLLYAKTKDYYTKRQNAYVNIYKKIWEVKG